MAKGNKVSVTDTNFNYIEEIEDSIPQLERKIKKLKEEQDEYELKLSKLGPLSIPFDFDRYRNHSALSSSYQRGWENYKCDVFVDWTNEGRGKKKRKCMHPDTHNWLFYLSYIAFIVAIVLCAIKGVHKQFGVGLIMFVACAFTSWEVLGLILDSWYWAIRPNMINRRDWKQKIKSIKSQIKVAENDLQVKSNMLEQYKLSTINPNEKFNNIKAVTIGNLRSAIEMTSKEVVPNIDGPFQARYIEILSKCTKLVDMATEDGRIVSEISQIYNIYLNEINNILIKRAKSSEISIDDIMNLLNNFEKYLDRKIDKFNSISDMLIKRDIEALNSAFNEEDT